MKSIKFIYIFDIQRFTMDFFFHFFDVFSVAYLFFKTSGCLFSLLFFIQINVC